MRQGLKDRIQFNPSNPSRMNMISTDYLLRNSFNNRIGNAFCAPNGTCSNVQDASGFWIRMDQNAQQTQRAYYAPFRQPIKGFRKEMIGFRTLARSWKSGSGCQGSGNVGAVVIWPAPTGSKCPM